MWQHATIALETLHSHIKQQKLYNIMGPLLWLPPSLQNSVAISIVISSDFANVLRHVFRHVRLCSCFSSATVFLFPYVFWWQWGKRIQFRLNIHIRRCFLGWCGGEHIIHSIPSLDGLRASLPVGAILSYRYFNSSICGKLVYQNCFASWTTLATRNNISKTGKQYYVITLN